MAAILRTTLCAEQMARAQAPPIFERNAANEEPSDGAKLAARQLAELRGWVLGSFAQVEFMLAYLIQRSALRWSVYASFATTLPYGVDKRASRVLRMLAVDGPLKAHETALRAIIADLLELEDFRHTMAHGFSTLLQAPNGFGVALRRYKPEKSDTWHFIEINIPLPELEQRANQAVATAHGAVDYFGKLFLHYRLDPAD